MIVREEMKQKDIIKLVQLLYEVYQMLIAEAHEHHDLSFNKISY